MTDVTADQIAQVRRMTGEDGTDPYTDDLITTYIEKYPHMDEFGEEQLDVFGNDNADWTPTFDLHGAAADIWEEKASARAAKFDFSADGVSASQSQQYEQFMKQCRYHRARMMPRTASMIKSPSESTRDESWIGNLPEPE